VTEYAEPNFPAQFIDNPNDPNQQFVRDLVNSLGSWAAVLQAILDKGISLQDNIDADVISYTSNGTPDTEDTVAHTLGKIPTYFIVGDIDKGGIVYRSGTTFTSSNIYVKCTVASAAVKLILI